MQEQVLNNAVPQQDNLDDIAATEQLIKRAKQGDNSVMPDLRKFMDQNPIYAEHHGNLSRQTQANWIKTIAGPNLHLAECLTRKVEIQRKALLSEGDSPVEIMLVDAIIINSLMRDCFVAQESNVKSDSPKWAEVRLKRLKAAIEQTDRAIRSLTEYRKQMFRLSKNQNRSTTTASMDDVKLEPLPASSFDSFTGLQEKNVKSTLANSMPQAASQKSDVAEADATSKVVKATPDLALKKSNYPTSKMKKPQRSQRSFDAGSNGTKIAAPVVSRPAEPQPIPENPVTDGTLRHPNSMPSEMLAK